MKPDLTKDRVVFGQAQAAGTRGVVMGLGIGYGIIGILMLLLDEVARGAVWLVMGGLVLLTSSTWHERLLPYVDREQVGWATGPWRRHTVLLSEITEVRPDTQDPRCATKVVLSLDDGTTREIPLQDPVELIEVLQVRRAEARHGDG